MKRKLQILFVLFITLILRCKNRPKNKSASNDAWKEQLKAELRKSGKNKNYKESLKIENLEATIIEDFGFEGIKLIFEARNSKNIFRLGEFNESCPWMPMNHLSTRKFIQTNFLNIKDKTPKLLRLVESKCRYIFAEKTESY